MKMESAKGNLEVFVYDCADVVGNVSSKNEDNVKVSKLGKRKKSDVLRGESDQPEHQEQRKTKRRSKETAHDSSGNGEDLKKSVKEGKKSPKGSRVGSKTPVKKSNDQKGTIISRKKGSKTKQKVSSQVDDDGIDKPKKRRHLESPKKCTETPFGDIPISSKSHQRSKSEEGGGSKRRTRRDSLSRLKDSAFIQGDFQDSKGLHEVLSLQDQTAPSSKNSINPGAKWKSPKGSRVGSETPVKKSKNLKRTIISPVESKKGSKTRQKVSSQADDDGIDNPKKRRHSESQKKSTETPVGDIPISSKSHQRSKSEEGRGSKRRTRSQLTDSASIQGDFQDSKGLHEVVSLQDQTDSSFKNSMNPGANRKSDRSYRTDDAAIDFSNTNLRCIEVERGVVLILGEQQIISLKGRVLLSVISGEITVYGHSLDQKSPEAKIVSPSSHSRITITTVQTDNLRESSVLDGCKKHLLTDAESDNVQSTIKNAETVLLLRKLDDNCCDFVSRVLPFHTLFGKSATNRNKDSHVNEVLRTINVKVYPVNEDTSTPVLNLPEDFFSCGERWIEILKQTDNSAKVMTCGGKNAGKSTFNKFLINFSLQSIKRLCYLDCDVGQTELNPPGSVALHILEDPLFGPPFSHQRDPYFMCFYGPVSPGDNPSLYSNCVQRVFSEYEKLDPKPPLIINTMGWNKGLGVNLLVDVCHMTHPDYVVQLDSINQANNFRTITPEYISTTPGWRYNRNGKDPQKFSHELAKIDSAVVPTIEKQFQFSARDLRDLATMGYFSRSLKTNESLDMAPVYNVPWQHLALHTTHTAVPPSEILSALNSSIVALCIADVSKAWRIGGNRENPLQFNRTPVCQCLGYGIVRGIDMEKHLLYIITPVDEISLTRVNTLMRGPTNLPDQLLLKQKCIGPLPYVDTHKSVTGSKAVRPRRYMPRRGRDQAQHDYLTDNVYCTP